MMNAFIEKCNALTEHECNDGCIQILPTEEGEIPEEFASIFRF